MSSSYYNIGISNGIIAWLIWHRGQDLIAWYTSKWPRYTSIWTLELDYSFQEDLSLKSPYSIVRGRLG